MILHDLYTYTLLFVQSKLRRFEINPKVNEIPGGSQVFILISALLADIEKCSMMPSKKVLFKIYT